MNLPIELVKEILSYLNPNMCCVIHSKGKCICNKKNNKRCNIKLNYNKKLACHIHSKNILTTVAGKYY